MEPSAAQPQGLGDNGTTYNGSVTNAAYAHVDTAENPGYLTHISAKP